MGRTWIVLLITTFSAFCIAQKSKKEQPKYFVTNWSQYGLPDDLEIEVGVLREILEKVAQFKRLSYCPFGDTFDSCRDVKTSGIISKIISDSLRRNATLPDVKHSLQEYVLFLDDKTGRGLSDSSCTCNLQKLDANQTLLNNSFKMVCECEEIRTTSVGLTRFKYLRVNPRARSKPGYIKNEIFVDLVDIN